MKLNSFKCSDLIHKVSNYKKLLGQRFALIRRAKKWPIRFENFIGELDCSLNWVQIGRHKVQLIDRPQLQLLHAISSLFTGNFAVVTIFLRWYWVDFLLQKRLIPSYTLLKKLDHYPIMQSSRSAVNYNYSGSEWHIYTQMFCFWGCVPQIHHHVRSLSFSCTALKFQDQHTDSGVVYGNVISRGVLIIHFFVNCCQPFI